MWNHRVGKDQSGFTIVEAYYTDPENPKKVTFWIERVSPFGETREELREDLNMMLDAFTRSVLDLTDVPDKKEDN